MKTPPTVAIEFASPGLLRIFASMVYDSLLLAAISIAYGAVIVGLRIAFFGQPDVGHRIEWSFAAGTFITLGWIIVIMFFYIYFWQKFGQTLGMKTWRIQVVDAQTNHRPNYSQAYKRSIAALFSLVVIGIGYWFTLVNVKRRSLHDLYSGTKLILLKKT